MSQTVQQRRCHAFALKDLAPLAECQIAGNQQAPAFVSISEYLEQQLGSGTTE